MSKLNVPGFVAGQVEPSFAGGGNALPVGRHKVSINKFDQKATKNNTGGYLEITIVALEGEYAGMKATDRLNVFNSSQVAVKIAIQKLSAYCHVLHRPDWNADNNELEELCNIPFYVDIVPQKDSTYTEIGDVFDINGMDAKGQPGAAPVNHQQAQTTQHTAQAQPAAAATNAAPAGWGATPANTQAQPAATNVKPETGGWGVQQTPNTTAATGGAPSWAK